MFQKENISAVKFITGYDKKNLNKLKISQKNRTRLLYK